MWVDSQNDYRVARHYEILHKQVPTDRMVSQALEQSERQSSQSRSCSGCHLRGEAVDPKGEAEETQSEALNMVNIAVVHQSVFVSFISVSLSHLQSITHPLGSNKE